MLAGASILSSATACAAKTVSPPRPEARVVEHKSCDRLSSPELAPPAIAVEARSHRALVHAKVSSRPNEYEPISTIQGSVEEVLAWQPRTALVRLSDQQFQALERDGYYVQDRDGDYGLRCGFWGVLVPEGTEPLPAPLIPESWRFSEHRRNEWCVLFDSPELHGATNLDEQLRARVDTSMLTWCQGTSCRLRATQDEVQQLVALPFVRMVTPFHPLYKVNPNVLCPIQGNGHSIRDPEAFASVIDAQSADDRSVEVRVWTSDTANEPDRQEVIRRLWKHLVSAPRVTPPRPDTPGGVLVGHIRVAGLHDIATHHSVVQIEHYWPIHLANR